MLTLFSCEWHAISSADDEVVDSSANSLGGLAIVVVEAEDAVVEAKIEPWEAQCPLNRKEKNIAINKEISITLYEKIQCKCKKIWSI